MADTKEQGVVGSGEQGLVKSPGNGDKKTVSYRGRDETEEIIVEDRKERKGRGTKREIKEKRNGNIRKERKRRER